MIALDPEFLGGLAPPSKLTGGVDSDAVPFARQPRIERLRVQGKADETEDVSEDEAASERPEDPTNEASKRDRGERQKRKMRGKGKSLKRCVGPHLVCIPCGLTRGYTRYLRKQRKNVIDPRTVSPDSSLLLVLFFFFWLCLKVVCQVAVREQLAKQRAEREGARVRVAESYDKSSSERPSALDRFQRRP